MLSNIRSLKGDDYSQATQLISDVTKSRTFKDLTFDYKTTFKNIERLSNEENSLSIGYFNKQVLEGVAIFTVVPSLCDDKDKKLVELAWDISPSIKSKIKKGRIMVTLFNRVMDYFKGSVNSIYLSVPLNSTINNFLIKKGFRQVDILYQKGVI